MPDAELLNHEERLNKIRKLISDLDARFNELLWSHPAKISKLEHYKPSVIPQFWTQYHELDERCSDYLEGKIEWEGDSLQMEFVEGTTVVFPRLEVDRDVQNFARDLYCWLALQVKDL